MPKTYKRRIVEFEDGTPAFYIFSDKEAGHKDYVQAFEAFQNGQQTPGFNILSAKGFQGIQGALRTGFETGVEKVTDVAKGADVQLLNLLNKLTPQALGQRPTDISQTPLGKGPNQLLTEQFDTPGELGMAVGLGGAGLATRGVSGALPAILRGLGAGGGQLAGEALTGNIENPFSSGKEALVTTGISLATEGVFGGMGKLLGRTLSERAQAQVSEDVMDLLKKKYGHIAGQGVDSINAMASTPKGMDDLISIGVKAFGGDVKSASNELVTRVTQTLRLNPDDMKPIRKLVEAFTEEAEVYLKAAGDIDKVSSSERKLNSIARDIGDALLNKAPKNVREDVFSLLNQFALETRNFSEGAEVLNGLRYATSPKDGFSVRRFQEYVRFRSGTPLFEEAATAAGRGVRRGIDTPVDFPLINRFNPLAKFGFNIPSGSTRFSGTVRGTIPDVAPGTTVVIDESIKDFFKRDK